MRQGLKKDVLVLGVIFSSLFLGIAILFYFFAFKGRVETKKETKKALLPKTPLDRVTFSYPVFKDDDGSVFFVGKIGKIYNNYLEIFNPGEKEEISFFLPHDILVYRFNSEIAKESPYAKKEASESLKINQSVRVDIDPKIDWKGFDKKGPISAMKVTILE